MKLRERFWILLAIFHSALAVAEVNMPTDAELRETGTVVDDILTKAGVPGAALSVIGRSGILWTHVFGYADRDKKVPMSVETFFRMGSLSKSCVAIGLLKLQESGKFRFDEKVADLIPEVPIENPWAATKPITVAHLFEHTSGLQEKWPRWGTTGPTNTPLIEIIRSPDLSYQVVEPPGRSKIYAQQNILLGGYILEKISGQKFEDFLRTNLFLPLEMTESSFQPTPLTYIIPPMPPIMRDANKFLYWLVRCSIYR